MLWFKFDLRKVCRYRCMCNHSRHRAMCFRVMSFCNNASLSGVRTCPLRWRFTAQVPSLNVSQDLNVENVIIRSLCVSKVWFEIFHHFPDGPDYFGPHRVNYWLRDPGILSMFGARRTSITVAITVEKDLDL